MFPLPLPPPPPSTKSVSMSLLFDGDSGDSTATIRGRQSAPKKPEPKVIAKLSDLFKPLPPKQGKDVALDSKSTSSQVNQVEYRLLSSLGTSSQYSIINLSYSPGFEVAPSRKITAAQNICIGDAHGNVLRVLYDLVQIGAIQEFSQIIWTELRTIFENAENLTPQQADRFENILLEHLMLVTNPSMVTFIGDMLCDRQGNDLLMLSLINAIDKKNIPFKIIWSNHDLLFFKSFFDRDNENSLNELDKNLYFYKSLERLGVYYNLSQVDEDNLEDKLNEYTGIYLKHLVLFDYRKDLELFITHAPVDKALFQNLFNKMQAVFSDSKNTEQNTPKITKESSLEDIFNEFQNLNKKFLESFSGDKVQFFEFLYSDELMDFAQARVVGKSSISNAHKDAKIHVVGHEIFKLTKGGKTSVLYRDGVPTISLDNSVGRDTPSQTANVNDVPITSNVFCYPFA